MAASHGLFSLCKNSLDGIYVFFIYKIDIRTIMWQNLSGKHELYEFVIKSYRKGEMVINTKQFFQFALICSVFVFGVGVINYSYVSTQQQIQHNHIVSNNQSNDLSSLHVLLNPDTGPVDDSKVPCVAFMVGREILPVTEPNYCLL